MSRSKSQKYLHQLNAQLEEVTTKLEQVSPSLHNVKPLPEKWSVVQILNHLYLIEQLNLNYLRYKLGQVDEFPVQKWHTIPKMLLYFFILKLPLKFKAPKVVSQPSNEDSYDELIQKYRLLRQDYAELIHKMDDSFFEKASCKHVIIGRLKLHHMIRFFKVHFQHHHNQIFKTLIDIA